MNNVVTGKDVAKGIGFLVLGALATLGVQHRGEIQEKGKKVIKKANKLAGKFSSWTKGKK